MVRVRAFANQPRILYGAAQTPPLQSVKGTRRYVLTIRRYDQEYSRLQIPIVR